MANTHLSYITRKLVIICLIFQAGSLLTCEAAAGSSPATDPGVAVSDRIVLNGSAAVIDSYSSATGEYYDAAVITVNSAAANSVALFDKASIRGDVYVGPGANLDRSIRLSAGSTITGSENVLAELIPIPNLTVPNIPPFNQPSQGNLTVKGDQSLVLDAAIHVDRLAINDKSVLAIDGNVLVLVDGDLNIGPDAQLQITPGSTLDIYVAGDCSVSGKLNTVAQDPQAVYLYMLGRDGVFKTSGSAEVFSVVQNPGGNVVIDTDNAFYGRIKARTLESSSAIHIDLNSGFPTQNQSGGSLLLEDLSGMELVAGNIYELTWTTDGGIDNVILEYSADTGQTWTTIDTVINAGSYHWQIPSVNSQDCYLRVLDASEPSNGVVSDRFTIYVCSLMFDLNGDCRVDAEDAHLMAKEWLKCGNPFDPKCN